MPVLSRLRQAREQKAMSQRDLAAASRVSQATIVRAEKGEDARFVTARKLAAALGVEPHALMDDDALLQRQKVWLWRRNQLGHTFKHIAETEGLDEQFVRNNVYDYAESTGQPVRPGGDGEPS